MGITSKHALCKLSILGGIQMKLNELYGPEVIEQMNNDLYAASNAYDMSIHTYANGVDASDEVRYDVRAEQVDDAIGLGLCDARCMSCNRHCMYSVRLRYTQSPSEVWTNRGYSNIDRYLPVGTLQDEIKWDDTRDCREKLDKEPVWDANRAIYVDEPAWHSKCANYIENKSTEDTKADYKARDKYMQKVASKFNRWMSEYTTCRDKDVMSKARIALEAVHIVLPYETNIVDNKYVINCILSARDKMTMVQVLLQMIIDANLCNELMEILITHKPVFMSLGQTMEYALRTNKIYKTNGIDPITLYRDSKKDPTMSMSSMERTNKDGKTYIDESKFQTIELGWDKPDFRSDEDIDAACLRDSEFYDYYLTHTALLEDIDRCKVIQDNEYDNEYIFTNNGVTTK